MTTLQMTKLGVRVEIRKTAQDTAGELFEFDVVGRARGFLTQAHVHTRQSERHEVIEGTMRLVIDGREHVLRPGEAMTVPAGAPHRQLAGPGHDGPGRVRVQLRPAGETEAFMRRLAEMEVNRWGYPGPLAAAQLVRDFGDEGHAASPPVRVQRALSRAILALASREYRFVDEWDVAAPRQSVFAAIADARSYPEWWKPLPRPEASSPLRSPSTSRPTASPRSARSRASTSRAGCPTTCTRSRIVRLEPGHVIEGEVDGDLRGHGRWTLTDTPGGGTHVRFDWRVHADRALLRVLTPVLRPAFRWNHAWAIARAVEGLEPYARARATLPG